MTSINSSSAAMSPADRMQLALQAAVSTGAVKTADQSALSSALINIDSSLQASGPPATGMDPGSIKNKVTSLIDDQVSSGTLTDDQATELKQVFAQAAGKMGGHHHHIHAPSDTASSANPIDALFGDLNDAIDNGLGTSGTSSTSGATAVASSSSAVGATSSSSADSMTASIDQLVSFLKQVEQKIAGNYTAAGTTSASATTNPVLIDATV